MSRKQKKDEAIIYGVKSGETYRYIGKTICVNHEGEVINSSVSCQYGNPDIRQVFQNNEITIEKLGTCSRTEWYDEKLQEVVQKHAEDHPLLNAQWMLDGKRGVWEGARGPYEEGGYWSGKKRDAMTLKALSQSKYINVCQYSHTGMLLQVWNGAKEAAIKVFGDYELINNSGKTQLYDALKATTMKGRFKRSCYWFREADLVKTFGEIPEKLDMNKLLAQETEIRRAGRKQAIKTQTHAMRHTVIHYNESGEVIATYDNTHHCAYELKIRVVMVQKFCRGDRTNNNYILKYGEKTKQELKLNYGRYKIKYKKDTTPKPKKPVPITRTRYAVNQYRNGVVVNRFDSVSDAALHFGLKESTIRRLCRDEMKLSYKKYPVLRLGKKIKIVIGYK